jgi:hypothetical protein
MLWRRIGERERAHNTRWTGGWVGPRTGLDDVEKRNFMTLPGHTLQPLGRSAHSHLQYQLKYCTTGTISNFRNRDLENKINSFNKTSMWVISVLPTLKNPFLKWDTSVEDPSTIDDGWQRSRLNRVSEPWWGPNIPYIHIVLQLSKIEGENTGFCWHQTWDI